MALAAGRLAERPRLARHWQKPKLKNKSEGLARGYDKSMAEVRKAKVKKTKNDKCP